MMKIIKFIGIASFVLLILLMWLFSSIFAQPLHVLITTTVITIALYKRLERENCWYKIAVVGIFIVVGGWYVFYNEIPGPMTWLICDSPVDTPSQWFECYRFYWCGNVIYTTALRGGIISFVFIFIVRLISKSKYNQNRSNNEICNVTKEILNYNRESTKGIMRVAEIYLGWLGGAIEEMLWEGIAINTNANLDLSNPYSPIITGDSIDGALLMWIIYDRRAGNPDFLRREVIQQLPHSIERKYQATIFVSRSYGGKVLFVNGEPEALLLMCSKIQEGLTKEIIKEKLADCKCRNMHTIGFAYQLEECQIDDDILSANNLTFLGFVAISDK